MLFKHNGLITDTTLQGQTNFKQKEYTRSLMALTEFSIKVLLQELFDLLFASQAIVALIPQNQDRLYQFRVIGTSIINPLIGKHGVLRSLDDETRNIRIQLIMQKDFGPQDYTIHTKI